MHRFTTCALQKTKEDFGKRVTRGSCLSPRSKQRECTPLPQSHPYTLPSVQPSELTGHSHTVATVPATNTIQITVMQDRAHSVHASMHWQHVSVYRDVVPYTHSTSRTDQQATCLLQIPCLLQTETEKGFRRVHQQRRRPQPVPCRSDLTARQAGESTVVIISEPIKQK